MNTVCYQIEARILERLRLELGGEAAVVGFRESAAMGTVKCVPGGLPEVRVTVSPGQSEGYSSPGMEYAVRVAVNLDLEDDPSTASFDAVSAVVEGLVERWNMNEFREETAALFDTDGFRCSGFRADGGTDSLDLSRENPRVCTVYAFAVKGVIKQNARS